MTTRGSATTANRLATAVVGEAGAAGALLVCSDYDGTLAPIAPTPEGAAALAAGVTALRWLSRAGAERGEGGRLPVRVAIITSRSCADLVGRIDLGREAVIVGSAGLERWRDGHVELDPAVVPWLPAIDDAAGRLATGLAEGRAPGARLERKQCGVAIHTRGLHNPVAETGALELAREVSRATALRVHVAKHAIELRPPLDTDKGTALHEQHVGRFAGAAVCAAGDDLPDVPMLEAAASLAHGVAVAVIDAETPHALLDAASHSLEGPWAWTDALGEMVRLLRA